jgi:hypothetical protein
MMSPFLVMSVDRMRRKMSVITIQVDGIFFQALIPQIGIWTERRAEESDSQCTEIEGFHFSVSNADQTFSVIQFSF